MALKETKAKARKIIRQTKRTPWHEHLQQFNSPTKINKIWNTIHAFKNNGNSTEKDIQLQINNSITK